MITDAGACRPSADPVAAHGSDDGACDRPESPEARTNLFVRNLPRHMDDGTLRSLFEPFGTIASLVVMRDIHTGKSKGTGFVRFASSADAHAAFHAFSKKPTQPAEGCPPSAGGGVATPASPGVDGEEHAAARGQQQPAPGGVGRRRERAKPISVKWASTARSGVPEDGAHGSTGRKLFIRNIPHDVSGEDLGTLLGAYGTVTSVELQEDTAAHGLQEPPGTHRRIAFVRFEEDGVLALAVQGIHGKTPFVSCGAVPLMAKQAESSRLRSSTGSSGSRTSSISSCCSTHRSQSLSRDVGASTATTTYGGWSYPAYPEADGPSMPRHDTPDGVPGSGPCASPSPHAIQQQWQYPLSADPHGADSLRQLAQQRRPPAQPVIDTPAPSSHPTFGAPGSTGRFSGGPACQGSPSGGSTRSSSSSSGRDGGYAEVYAAGAEEDYDHTSHYYYSCFQNGESEEGVTAGATRSHPAYSLLRAKRRARMHPSASFSEGVPPAPCCEQRPRMKLVCSVSLPDLSAIRPAEAEERCCGTTPPPPGPSTARSLPDGPSTPPPSAPGHPYRCYFSHNPYDPTTGRSSRSSSSSGSSGGTRGRAKERIAAACDPAFP